MITKTLAIAALTQSVSAWWNQGHLLTARTAYDILMEDSPDTVKGVEKSLSFLKASDPGWTINESLHPMVECATFADFIKYKGGSYQKGWHFIDTPYFDEGGDLSDWPQFQLEPYNITVAINGMHDWFLKGDDSGYAAQQVISHGYGDHTPLDDMSTGMRFLIHYIADIHQPLHSTSRVDSAYPAGDRGGNSFHVQSRDGAKNLHAVWDSVIYSEHTDMKTPLSETNWADLGAEAKKLRTKYEDANLLEMAKDLDTNNWVVEMSNISQETVYANIKEDTLPSEDYVTKAAYVSQRQIVLGGHRLANYLRQYDYSKFFASSEQNLEAVESEREIIPTDSQDFTIMGQEPTNEFSIKNFVKNIFDKFNN